MHLNKETKKNWEKWNWWQRKKTRLASKKMFEEFFLANKIREKRDRILRETKKKRKNNREENTLLYKRYKRDKFSSQSRYKIGYLMMRVELRIF